MAVDFSNVNTVWASVLVETLWQLGVRTAIVCPGSRSAPLAVAFACHADIEAIPILDERSAAFFALGLARQSHRPVVLVCTSGTAGANFYPAIIEAHESRVPLLVLTADRPPELRDCNAGQAIDQQKFYGHFPNWYSELAVPMLDLSLLAYLRQTIIHAWERTLYPVAGAVHLNLPFRDPLAPVLQAEAQTFAARFPTDFFAFIAASHQNKSLQTSSLLDVTNRSVQSLPPPALMTSLPSEWLSPHRGILVAGPAQPADPERYCVAIAHLAKILRLPVLAEGLSPLRTHADLNPYLISTYDLMLRQASLADKLAPEWVIRVGDMPTSKSLRQWLTQLNVRQWVIDPADRNLDPLHGSTIHWRASIEQVAALLPQEPLPPSATVQQWCDLEQQMRQAIDSLFEPVEQLVESKVAWLLAQHLPPETALFVANSMPVRDIEWFWPPQHSRLRLFFNRGANGIDGTLSTALGVAHRQRSSVLLTGDLALLHDTNGCLLRDKVVGHLTIVLINNNGGGIFEMLPISQFDPPFESFFATPQAIDFAKLCAAYGIEHERIQSWEHLIHCLNPLPAAGIRVLEICTDRKADAQWRQQTFQRLVQTLLA